MTINELIAHLELLKYLGKSGDSEVLIKVEYTGSETLYIDGTGYDNEEGILYLKGQ